MEKQSLPYNKIIFVCVNERGPGERACCANSGGAALHARLKEMVKERGLRGRIRVSKSGCMNRCEAGPNIMVFPDNVWYSHAGEGDVEAIFECLVESLRAEGQLPKACEG
ncbi:MAG TPA: (2Fe-2S) ferredoxin domain-containing protein [Candidatus Hydrogenedentes bacterium]|nr:(2Fe-2S) ferredoxin domain-containing protein [Candidatus Hydrogenedentota bacterium]HQM49642.1 (2Fe-2S) ferredoxin domain-containing protein [Candidatus Hydrogenedentota bacterium]